MWYSNRIMKNVSLSLLNRHFLLPRLKIRYRDVFVCPGRDAIVRINYYVIAVKHEVSTHIIILRIVWGIILWFTVTKRWGQYNNTRCSSEHSFTFLCPRYVTFCHHRTTNRDCFSVHSFSDYIVYYVILSESAKHSVLASAVLIKFDQRVLITL